MKDFGAELRPSVQEEGSGRGQRGEKAEDLALEKSFNRELSRARVSHRAHGIEGQEVQHLRVGVLEQAEALPHDDRHSLRLQP